MLWEIRLCIWFLNALRVDFMLLNSYRSLYVDFSYFVALTVSNPIFGRTIQSAPSIGVSRNSLIISISIGQ